MVSQQASLQPYFIYVSIAVEIRSHLFFWFCAFDSVSVNKINKMHLEKFCCCVDLIDGTAFWGIISTVLRLFEWYNFDEIQHIWSSMLYDNRYTSAPKTNMATVNIFYTITVISSVLLTYGAVKVCLKRMDWRKIGKILFFWFVLLT